MDTRAWRSDFDLSKSEGRIIRGIAVPFNNPTQIAEHGRIFDETFKPGSTRDSIRKRGDRIRLLGHHDSRAWPIGKPVELDDTSRGLEFAAHISDTREGNDALTLIGDGAVDGVSVGFGVPEGGDVWSADGSERTITRADIFEFSLVNFPAYDRARVESVRAADNYTEPHTFQDANGDGICDVCGDDVSDGNHTSIDADGHELTHRADDAPYGAVAYADPGYQKDGKKRYPIDTKEHAKAAWSYINQSANADLYSAADLAKVKAKITAALKKFGVETKSDLTAITHRLQLLRLELVQRRIPA